MPLLKEVLAIVRQAHNEVAVQGWKEKELTGYLEEQAIKGMLHALDPHSDLLTTKELEAWDYGLNPTYSGIGSYVQMDEEARILILTQPMFGGPAYRSGVEPGGNVTSNGSWRPRRAPSDRTRAPLSSAHARNGSGGGWGP